MFRDLSGLLGQRERKVSREISANRDLEDYVGLLGYQEEREDADALEETVNVGLPDYRV